MLGRIVGTARKERTLTFKDPLRTMRRRAAEDAAEGTAGTQPRRGYAEWRQRLVERYGAEPSVAYFASPVSVDNLSGEIITD